MKDVYLYYEGFWYSCAYETFYRLFVYGLCINFGLIN